MEKARTLLVTASWANCMAVWGISRRAFDTGSSSIRNCFVASRLALPVMIRAGGFWFSRAWTSQLDRSFELVCDRFRDCWRHSWSLVVVRTGRGRAQEASGRSKRVSKSGEMDQPLGERSITSQ